MIDEIEDENMLGGDEIILTGKYKQFNATLRFDLSKASETDVVGGLNHVSNEIESYAYGFSGIDTIAIEKFVNVGNGLGAVCDFLEKNTSEWKKKIIGSMDNQKLASVAESYLFNQLLTKAGVQFKANTGKLNLKPEKEEQGDYIAYVGKYKNWISIKKLSLDNAKDYEISGILSGINHSVVNKAFDFAGIQKDDRTVSSLVSAKRKSYGNAMAVLRELAPSLSGKGEDAYLVCKVLEQLSYPPYATPGMLTKAYPDIKPPKVKGRKPKA
ncbi:DUF2666 domain-containing protein [Candidatus Micrarchaeota archaeon]|nr:DUF2666 domain-containing protein [Candidatus Micrarchaeota archaeon]MBU1166246.1 DUF2666 domain-containing protein [Candidatus Micrarchaeota archaeon]MBU1886797.1 DUF2666 domain-containing protein [Candidatus Micrarchaeota archaeon]